MCIWSASKLFDGLLRRDRVSLARCITLLESTLSSHRAIAEDLMERVNSHTPHSSSYRIGICGSPGVGKSSVIETLGKVLIAKHSTRIGVLPVDPSSSVSHGSILGDKLRMPYLSNSEYAFIRGSPNKGIMGGITENTVDVISVCEASGYDTLFIESVGIGQGEIDIANAVDVVMLVISPGSGDDIQAMKKGIMEVVDIIVVNKSDGELEVAATESMNNYSNALHKRLNYTDKWKVPVLKMSCVSMVGVDEVLASLDSYKRHLHSTQLYASNRVKQSEYWMWNSYRNRVVEEACADRQVVETSMGLTTELAGGKVSIRRAVSRLLQCYREGRTH